MTLNAHFAAAHGMTADYAYVGTDFTPAGQSEILPQMSFFRRSRRKKFHPLSDFHQAFPAFPLLVTGSGNFDSHRFSAIEQRKPRCEFPLLEVEVYLHFRIAVAAGPN